MVIAETELRRMEPVTVGSRPIDDVGESAVPRPPGRGGPVIDVGNRAVAEIILHGNERRIERILLPAPPIEIRPQLSTGLEHQARVDRRGPGELRHQVRMVLVSRDRFGCRDDSAEGEPVAVAALDAVEADVLNLRPCRDLVARCRLPRQPQLPVLPRAVVLGLLERATALAVGGEIRPFGRIAGVQVHVHVGDALAVDLVAISTPEPQLVFDDRAANRGVDVPGFVQGVGRLQPLRLNAPR